MYRRYQPKNPNVSAQHNTQPQASNPQNQRRSPQAAQPPGRQPAPARTQQTGRQGAGGMQQPMHAEHQKHTAGSSPPPGAGARPTPQRHAGQQQHPQGHTRNSGQHQTADRPKHTSPLFGLIPPSLYNPETKKVLGFLSAEDLLLIALIFLFLDNEDNDDPMIIYALLYILLSDYVDLGDLLSL